MELIHRQPVRWTHNKVVSCDGGGGPLGHPKIFINTDKPQITYCEYCGTPYVRCSFSIQLSFSLRLLFVPFVGYEFQFCPKVY